MLNTPGPGIKPMITEAAAKATQTCRVIDCAPFTRRVTYLKRPDPRWAFDHESIGDSRVPHLPASHGRDRVGAVRGDCPRRDRRRVPESVRAVRRCAPAS